MEDDRVKTPQENATDYMGVDVIVRREAGKFAAYVIEVNDFHSGAAWDLDQALREAPADLISSSEALSRLGEGSFSWIDTMYQRGLEYKHRVLKDQAMTAIGNFSKEDQAVIEEFDNLKDVKKAVDLGSGGGQFLINFRAMHPNTRIIGYTPVREHSVEGLIKGDSRNTGLKENSVDIVTINMPKPSETYINSVVIRGHLVEAKRILKPGGQLNITFESHAGDRLAELESALRQQFAFEEKRYLSAEDTSYPKTEYMAKYQSLPNGVTLLRAYKQQVNQIEFYHADNAMSAKGGIDLNSLNRRLNVQADQQAAIKFNIDPDMLQKLQDTPGFVPVIINIQPADNIRSFLGIEKQPIH